MGMEVRTCPFLQTRAQAHIMTILDISPLFSSSNWKYLHKQEKQFQNQLIVSQQTYPLTACQQMTVPRKVLGVQLTEAPAEPASINWE